MARDDKPEAGLPEAQHPGRTLEEQTVLDVIGDGNTMPTMTDETRETMLRDGLIEPVYPDDPGGPVQMPIKIQIYWQLHIDQRNG